MSPDVHGTGRSSCRIPSQSAPRSPGATIRARCGEATGEVVDRRRRRRRPVAAARAGAHGAAEAVDEERPRLRRARRRRRARQRPATSARDAGRVRGLLPGRQRGLLLERRPRRRGRPAAPDEALPADRRRHVPVDHGQGRRHGAASSLSLGAAALTGRWETVAVVAVYVVLVMLYSAWLKHIAVVDIVTVASGFVLRAAGGAVAVDVPMSNWFVLVTVFGSLFIVAGKRYAELREIGDDAQLVRATLADYSAQLPAHRAHRRRAARRSSATASGRSRPATGRPPSGRSTSCRSCRCSPPCCATRWCSSRVAAPRRRRSSPATGCCSCSALAWVVAVRPRRCTWR